MTQNQIRILKADGQEASTPDDCGAFTMTPISDIDPFELHPTTGLLSLKTGQSWPTDDPASPYGIKFDVKI